jgi:toxin ParE1/3/4
MYTERRWGTRQRHAYRAKLLSATAALGENPLLGIALDHIRAGLRAHSVESHILYYLIRHGEINTA